MSNVKSNLLFFAAPTESLGCTSLMGAPPCVRLTLVISTKRITWLHYSYECATLSKAYACLPLFPEGLGYTKKRVCNLYCNLCCLALPTKSWGLQYTSGCATLNKAYAGYLHLENHWVKLQLWVRHLKCSLCLLPLFSESLGYTTHMGV